MMQTRDKEDFLWLWDHPYKAGYTHFQSSIRNKMKKMTYACKNDEMGLTSIEFAECMKIKA